MEKKSPEKRSALHILTGAGRCLVMAFVLFISIYPILWVFLSSFKKNPGGLALPTEWVFDGYITIFTKLSIQTYFGNSIFITVISTVISVLVVAMSAYVSARMEFKLKGLVTLMFTTTLFIPSISISFPIYRLLGDLGLKDTRGGLIFIYSGLGIAVTFFIIRSYFLTIPREMEEAASIDGAGRLKRIWHITLPGIKGSIVTVLILSIGSFLGGGMVGSNFEQSFLMGNTVNNATSEIIQTYAFKMGMAQGRFSYATAVDLVQSVISIVLVIISNQVAKKVSGEGLF